MLVYALYSPSGELRYIGSTTKPVQVRFLEHLRPSSLARERSYKSRWIQKVLSGNERPCVSVIQEYLNVEDMHQGERYWIDFFRKNGCRLVNTTEGGEGCWGRIPTDKTRKAVSRAQKGRQRTPSELALNAQNQPHKKKVSCSNGMAFVSIADAARKLGIDKKHIGKVVGGKRKTAGGLTFRLIGV